MSDAVLGNGNLAVGAVGTGSLGRLARVTLRNVWQSESGDFTPWLAKEENIALLGEAIGLELEVEAQEKNVGPFRADILCKDTATSDWVLIENQLERTDHSHLGQLLTYAAGLHAVTIVWIAERFTEEHRAALDWLNEATSEGINFFGLEIELWRIGTSPAAPKFNVVSKPNDWTRIVSEVRVQAAADLTETQRRNLAFWTSFAKRIEERGNPIRAMKPSSDHWKVYSIGRSGFHLSAVVNSRDKWVAVQFVMNDSKAKQYFSLLASRRSEIEALLGLPGQLDWRELPDGKESRIELTRRGVDPADEGRWQDLQDWMIDRIILFRERLSAIVKDLDAAEAVPNPSVDSSDSV